MYTDLTIPKALKTSKSLKKPQPRVRWDKMDRVIYREETAVRLNALVSNMDGMPACLTVYRLNSILAESARQACPPPSKGRKNRKSKWYASFKPIVKDINKTYHEFQKVHPSLRKNSPLQAKLKTAQRILRKAQRQAAAKRRRDITAGVIDTCKKKNEADFYKLVKKQRDSHRRPADINFGKFTTNTAANSWAQYFKHLATP